MNKKKTKKTIIIEYLLLILPIKKLFEKKPSDKNLETKYSERKQVRIGSKSKKSLNLMIKK